MKKETLWVLQPHELTSLLNQGKETHLANMLKENIITEEQHTQMLQYSILVEEKGLLGKIWDKLFPKGNESFFTIVKVIRCQ